MHKTLVLAIILSIASAQTVGAMTRISPSTAEERAVLKDSLVAATQRLAFHPDSLELRLDKASWNMLLEQWDYALDEYDYILRRDPHNRPALYFRAYANTQLARYKFARLDYETLLAIEPGHFSARLGLALLCNRDNRQREALDRLNSLCQDYPQSAEALAARAEIEWERGMVDVALYDYQEAVKLERDPQQRAIYQYRLQALTNQAAQQTKRKKRK